MPEQAKPARVSGGFQNFVATFWTGLKKNVRTTISAPLLCVERLVLKRSNERGRTTTSVSLLGLKRCKDTVRFQEPVIVAVEQLIGSRQ